MEELGDLVEFGKKNATQIMIFLPHYMWAENKKYIVMVQWMESYVNTIPSMETV